MLNGDVVALSPANVGRRGTIAAWLGFHARDKRDYRALLRSGGQEKHPGLLNGVLPSFSHQKNARQLSGLSLTVFSSGGKIVKILGPLA